MIYDTDKFAFLNESAVKYVKIKSGKNIYWINVNKVSSIDVSNEKSLLDSADYAVDTQYGTVMKCKGLINKDVESLVDRIIALESEKPKQPPMQLYRSGEPSLQQYRADAQARRIGAQVPVEFMVEENDSRTKVVQQPALVQNY